MERSGALRLGANPDPFPKKVAWLPPRHPAKCRLLPQLLSAPFVRIFRFEKHLRLTT